MGSYLDHVRERTAELKAQGLNSAQSPTDVPAGLTAHERKIIDTLLRSPVRKSLIARKQKEVANLVRLGYIDFPGSFYDGPTVAMIRLTAKGATDFGVAA